MAGKQRFKAVLQPSGRGGGHIVEVPTKVTQALGGKRRIPVTATFNGVPYRGSIVRMGEVAILGVTKAIMEAAEVSPGEKLDVVVELDLEPRHVEIPAEFAEALARSGLRDAFEAMSYSHRREHVEAILEAKREDTRQRRIERALEMITGRQRAK
jgi:hypothetical protein